MSSRSRKDGPTISYTDRTYGPPTSSTSARRATGGGRTRPGAPSGLARTAWMAPSAATTQSARMGRLAWITPDGRPHVVVITFSRDRRGHRSHGGREAGDDAPSAALQNVETLPSPRCWSTTRRAGVALVGPVDSHDHRENRDDWWEARSRLKGKYRQYRMPHRAAPPSSSRSTGSPIGSTTDHAFFGRQPADPDVVPLHRDDVHEPRCRCDPDGGCVATGRREDSVVVPRPVA